MTFCIVLLTVCTGVLADTRVPPAPHELPSLQHEAALQARHRQSVHRVDTGLTILAANGAAVQFPTVRSNDPTFKQSYLMDWLEPLQWAVVQTGLWEGLETHLIDTRTGRVTELDGLPQLSPDGHRLLVHCADLEAQYNRCTLVLYKIGDNGLQLEFRLDGDRDPKMRWAPENARWLAPDRIAFERAQWIDNQRTLLPQQLRFDGKQWQLLERASE